MGEGEGGKNYIAGKRGKKILFRIRAITDNPSLVLTRDVLNPAALGDEQEHTQNVAHHFLSSASFFLIELLQNQT